MKMENKEKLRTFFLRHKKLFITAISLAFAGGSLLFAFVMGSFFYVKSFGKMVYTSLESTPPYEYALLLGTARKVKSGNLNLFFQYRMEAAAALYKAGKVKKIILSGDNSRKEYNEVGDMKDSLIAMGVPERALLPDYAGFRTLDSICRAKSLYGAEKLLIISQHFHCRRAIFLADHYGISAAGFAAKDVPLRICYKMLFREPLACFKACLDLWLLQTKPKFAR